MNIFGFNKKIDKFLFVVMNKGLLVISDLFIILGIRRAFVLFLINFGLDLIQNELIVLALTKLMKKIDFIFSFPIYLFSFFFIKKCLLIFFNLFPQKWILPRFQILVISLLIHMTQSNWISSIENISSFHFLIECFR